MFKPFEFMGTIGLSDRRKVYRETCNFSQIDLAFSAFILTTGGVDIDFVQGIFTQNQCLTLPAIYIIYTYHKVIPNVTMPLK